jgi:hypothetical protein
MAEHKRTNIPGQTKIEEDKHPIRKNRTRQNRI